MRNQPVERDVVRPAERRLAAVLNDRLTSDSDRKAACTLIHTSCYDEANAKLVVDIDIVPQIVKIAKDAGKLKQRLTEWMDADSIYQPIPSHKFMMDYSAQLHSALSRQ